MYHTEVSMREFLTQVEQGVRKFKWQAFPESESAPGLNLSNVTFEYCFLFFDMKQMSLQGTKFVNCNLKFVDFMGSNLTSASIQGCSIEGLSLFGANIRSLVFEDNWYMGNRCGPEDLKSFAEP